MSERINDLETALRAANRMIDAVTGERDQLRTQLPAEQQAVRDICEAKKGLDAQYIHLEKMLAAEQQARREAEETIAGLRDLLADEVRDYAAKGYGADQEVARLAARVRELESRCNGEQCVSRETLLATECERNEAESRVRELEGQVEGMRAALTTLLNWGWETEIDTPSNQRIVKARQYVYRVATDALSTSPAAPTQEDGNG